MKRVYKSIRRNRLAAEGKCIQCATKLPRGEKKPTCQDCRTSNNARMAKRRPPGSQARARELCECGRGPKVRRRGGFGTYINCCKSCLEQDGGTEATFAVIQAIRASESPPSVYAIAMECEVSVDAAAHTISRLVKKGVIGKRTQGCFGGVKDNHRGEMTEYYEAKRGAVL